MNIKENRNSHDHLLKMLHTEPHLTEAMSRKIISWFPNFPREYVVICIGTDRSTGDSLGPLTGSLLTDLNLKHMTVYGSLHNPVHAQNLQEQLNLIQQNHRRPYIIAIDACLGRNKSVGKIISGIGPLKPGQALNKVLPAVGDIHITGVVNISGFMQYAILQNTRLSIVTDMAKSIASIISTIDQQLTYNASLPAMLKQDFQRANVE